MEYKLRITYFDNDEKCATLFLQDKEMCEFFDKLNKNQPYINNNSHMGFWTQLDKIRHIIIFPNKEGAKIEKVEKDQPDSKPLSAGDENSQG